MRARLPSLVAFVPTAAVLVLARWLTPDPAGVGTHTQLGLEPCAVLTWADFPCPMCGMTTTFSLLAHFRPVDAVVNQPFGVVLFAMTVMTAAISLLEIAHPQNRWDRLLQRIDGHEVALSSCLIAGLMAGWAYKIIAMGYLF
mgnify:CR=1 FL=1